MTSIEQEEVYVKLDKRIMDLTFSKRHDYGSEDVLSNFKQVSGAAKALGIDVTNPTGYSLFMVILKIARLTNLLNAGKTPKNESITDSFEDGINYFKLALCNYLDEEKLPLFNQNATPKYSESISQ